VVSDVGRIVGKIVSLTMYITPVIYTTDFEHPVLKFLVKYNPLSYLISAGRDILTIGRIEHFDSYLFISVLALVIFMISLRLFYVSESLVTEKM
jgi:ABC-type polysaccharide/polyol phosphate export permease